MRFSNPQLYQKVLIEPNASLRIVDEVQDCCRDNAAGVTTLLDDSVDDYLPKELISII